VTHSWELDRRIIESVRIPAIIAGGLGPENVQDAVRVVRPAGVDSKTKTDRSDGTHTKDLEKVSAFLNAARSANSKISDASTLHQICERKRKCIPLIYVPDVP
jgi:phosphoribosylanthranilate isomerase